MSRKLILLVLLLALPLAAQNASAPPAKSAPASATSTIDKAYLQSIWNAWATNDIENQGRFYVQGPGHLFFDVAPLKYSSWDEYKAGVAPSLKDAPKVTYTVNDDVQIHPEGKVTWVASTLDMTGAGQNGEKQTITLRWSAVFEQHDGRWLIAQEHVSAAAEPPQQ